MAKRVNTPFVSVVGGIIALVAVAGFALPWLKAHVFTAPLAERVKHSEAEADKDLAEGRLAEAREAITNAWKMDPSNKEICIKRGDILMKLTQDEGREVIMQAIGSWENALANDPTYKPALQRLLDAYIEELEVQPTPEACMRLRDAATRSFQMDPTNMRAKSYIYIATIQQWVQGMPTTADQTKQAIAKLAEIQKADPTSADVLFYYLRGRAFQAADDYRTSHTEAADAAVKECRDLLDTLVAKYPKDSSLNFRIFQGYVMLMDVGREPEQVKKDHVSADGALARARENVKPDDKRYDDFQYVASDWARRNGHLDAAEKILRDFYKLRGTDQRVRLALCRVLALTGDPVKRDEAIGLLDQPIGPAVGTGWKVIGTKELEAQTLLDLTSMRVAQYPTLEPAKRQALMNKIDDGLKKVISWSFADAIPVLRLQGLVAQLKGQNVEAVEHLSRAMTLLEHSDNNNPIKYDLMYQLATVQRLAQQNHSAESLLIKIVDRFDGYTPARFQLADLYLEEGNLAEAARNIDALAKQKPGSPDVLRLQVMLNQRAGKTKDAIALAANLPEATFDEKVSKAQITANLFDYPTAIRLLEDMRKDHPDDTGIIVALWQACHKAGGADQVAQAKKALDEALKAHPKDPRLQLLGKQEDKATQADMDAFVIDVMRTNDPFAAKIHEARAALEKRNFVDALARTQEADRIRLNDPGTWDMYFNIYMVQQNWEMAERAVENLARLNADQAGGLMYRWKMAMGRAQYNDAIAAGRELTKLREEFGQSWILLAQAFQANGQYTEAVEKYQAALERQTTNIDAYKGMADCYEANSQPDRAFDIISRGLRSFPDNIYLRERKLELEGKTNPLAVVTERQKILDDNPKEPENYLAMAAACLQAAQKVVGIDPRQAQDFTSQARDVLTKGVGKFPTHLRLNGALADALQSAKKSDDGVKILQDLAKLPEWKGKAEPSLLLGEYYARGKDPAKAEAAFREAWATTGNKNIDIQLRIVALLEDQKSFDKCLEVLEANKGDQRVARQTLQVHIAAGHTEIARTGLEKAIVENKTDVNLRNLLAVVNIDGGKYPEARQVLAQALAMDPRNDISLYYQALVELRDVDHGDLGLALRNLARVVETNPANVQFRLESAGAKLRIRDTEGAATDLEEALHYEPLNRDARLRLLDLYTQTKKWSKFEKVVAVAELDPRISEGVWFRAHAYALAAQGKFPEAVAKIREAIAIAPKDAIFARDYLIILLQAGDNQGVISETERLAANGHNEWWVSHLRGLANFAAGNKDAALERLDKALTIADEAKDDDGYQQVLTSIADISVDAAIARITPKAATIDRWRLQKVMLLMRKGDWAVALSELDPILKNRANLPRETRLSAIRLAADIYQRGGKPQMAKDFYLEWINESPNDTTALNNFAYLLAEDLNEPTIAKKYSQQAYDAGRKLNYIDPLIVDTHGWILTLCKGSDASQGLSILGALVDGHGDFLEARFHLGKGLYDNNRFTDAVVQFQAALDQIDAMEKKNQRVAPQFKERLQKSLAEAQAKVGTK